MKKVLFFPPAYVSSQPVLLEMPDTAAGALIAAGVAAEPIAPPAERPTPPVTPAPAPTPPPPPPPAPEPSNPSWTAPPADWRMPALAAYSTVPAAQTAMVEMQATAATKTRTSWTHGAATHSYAYQVGATDTDLILTWSHQRDMTTVVEQSFDSTNGQDGAWATLRASTSGMLGDRDALLVSASANPRWVRLVATAATSGTLSILLMKKPASGLWDATQVFGGSREGTGMASASMEGAIRAQFPDRDPLVFNPAQSGATIEGTRDRAIEKGPLTVGIVAMNYIGAPCGNNITADRPYTTDQGPSYRNKYDSLVNAIRQFQPTAPLFIDDVSYRAYPVDGAKGAVAVDTQAGRDNGSGPYNRNAVWNRIEAHSPISYDPDLKVGRLGDYFYELAYRLHLAPDGVHENYPNMRRNKASRLWRFIYTGVWPQHYVYDLVARAEATLLDWDRRNARYAVEELPDTPARTALLARVNALAPALKVATARFHSATVSANTNSVLGTTQDATVDNMVDIANAPTGWKLTVTDKFEDASSSAGDEESYLSMLASLTGHAFGSASAEVAALELSGLDPARKYMIVAIPAVGYVGPSTPTRKTIYTVNGVDGAPIEAITNHDVFYNSGRVSPTAEGKITIGVRTGGGSRSYLNRLRIEEYAA